MVEYENKELQFVYLWMACKRYLKHASECESGQFYDCMTSMIYAAFVIESYLNEVGDRLFDDWQNNHDGKAIKEKIKLIGNQLGKQFDLGKKPFLSLDKIIAYRTLVVHSKAQNLSEDVSNETAMNDDYSGPRSAMDEQATIDNARQFLTQAETIVKAINKYMPAKQNAHALLKPDQCPFRLAGGGGTI